VLLTKQERLQELEAQYKDCKKCSNLYQCRLDSKIEDEELGNTVFGTGNLNANILIVGEAPGLEEDLTGEPFVGPSGKMLDKLLHQVCLISKDSPRTEVLYTTNVVMCRPPSNRKPTKDEITNCWKRLCETIYIIDPLIVLLLGNVALSAFFGDKKKITSSKGEMHTVEIPGMFGPVRYPAFPIFHPSYLLRNPSENKKDGPIVSTILDLQKMLASLDTFQKIENKIDIPIRDITELREG